MSALHDGKLYPVQRAWMPDAAFVVGGKKKSLYDALGR
jgi:hypothetical protein